jgi:hypothetical protein
VRTAFWSSGEKKVGVDGIVGSGCAGLSGGGGRTNGGNAQLVSAAGCGCGRQDVELLVRRRRRQQIDGSGYPLFSEMAVPNDRNADFTGSTLQRLTQ